MMTRDLNLKVMSLIVLTIFCLLVGGCVVRTYTQTKERMDQDLGGNRGYLQGQAPPPESDRPTTRTHRVIEIELYPPLKFDKTKPESKAVRPEPKVEDEQLWGNRGFVQVGPEQEESGSKTLSSVQEVQSYKVKKKDTLQKISLRFYGTTRKWPRIYEANRDKLKHPSKIYPGQTLIIPRQ